MKQLFILLFLLASNGLFAQRVILDSIGDNSYIESPLYLVFEDHFDGESLDLEKWDLKYGHLRGFESEMQIYIPGNVEVNHSILKLWARKDSVTGPCISGENNHVSWGTPITKAYSSGEIDSKRKFLYGKFEARLKCPYGSKFWPAFWIQNGSANMHNYCEIDIVEAWGTSHANCTVHDFDGSAPPHPMRPYRYSDFKFDNWHTYTMVWTPFKIQFYLDNNFITEVYHYTEKKKRKGIDYSTISSETKGFKKPWPFPNPSNVIFNFALNSGLPGDLNPFLPACFEIDYLKVWQPVADFEITGTKEFPKNTIGQQIYSVPTVEGATYSWDFPILWSGRSLMNQLTVSPDSLSGGNLSVTLSFPDGQKIVKDINIYRSSK